MISLLLEMLLESTRQMYCIFNQPLRREKRLCPRGNSAYQQERSQKTIGQEIQEAYRCAALMCPHDTSGEPPLRSRVSEPVNDLRPQRMAEDHKKFGHFIQRILVLPPFFNLKE